MMDEKLDVRQALRVFQKVTDHGDKEGPVYALNGLTAQTDYDGYTITLADDYVTLHVLFHSRYNLQCKNQKDLSLFLQKLKNVDKLSFS